MYVQFFTSSMFALLALLVSTSAWTETGDFSGLASEVFDCGGEVTAGNEVVETPGFPDFYPPDLDCLWVVRTAPGWRIRVTSEYFGLEDQSTCLWDYLEIKDGAVNDATGRVRYCGNEVVSFLSSSDVISLNFQTDASGDGIGFRITFTPESARDMADMCNSTLRNDQGFITSPGYPLNYPSSVLCHYTIEGPIGSTISLEFQHFDVESYPCYYDRLEIVDGSDEASNAIAKLCGSVAPDNVTSSQNVVTLIFKSDKAVQTSGFNISYNINSAPTTTTSTTPSTTSTAMSTKANDCHNTWSDDEGNITSPGYPEVYPHNTDCVTVIRAEVPSTIILEILTFDLEESENCSYDVLVLESEAYSNESATKIRLCGHGLQQRVYTFETSSLTLTLTSDTSVNAGGYFAHFIVSPIQSELVCSLQCNNGGSCVSMDNDTDDPLWRCECAPGFYGDACEHVEEVTCEEHACHNGGTCFIQNGVPNCHCPPRYTDPLCETRLYLKSDEVTFTTAPHNMTVALGSSVLLECAVLHGEVDIMWLHRDRILSEYDHTEGLEVHPGGVLHIPEVSDGQDGKYTCVALSHGNLFERSAWISLKEPCKLRVVEAPKNVTVSEGATTMLRCYIPNSQFTIWKKDGEIIHFDNRKRMLRNKYLLIKDIVETDAGEYTCAARGANGCSARESATLTVEGFGHEKSCGRPRVVKEQSRGGRIAGGKEVQDGEAPWHVIIRDKRHKTAFCGGSMVNTQWLVTAAHCVTQFEEYYLYPFSKDAVDIYIGSVRCDGKQGIHRRLKNYTLHPDFNGRNFDNDVALFQLDQPVEFSDLVMPICLESEVVVKELLLGGRLGMITGCGSLYEEGMSPTFLREVSIPYVNTPVCHQSAKNVNASFTSGMICAGYSRSMRGDACHGDSGGPYVMKYGGRWILVGIVSWGVGCDRENQYGYYTHVSKYYDWILGNSVEVSGIEDEQ